MADDNKKLFGKFTAVMDQNIRGIQIGVYGVAAVGVLVAFRSVRPFLKFRSAKNIPEHFISKNMSFRGRVIRVEPSNNHSKNPIILINHYPVFALTGSKDCLPVQVSSIDVTANGVSWMQCIVVNNDVAFTPLRKEGDVAICSVEFQKQNVGLHLVSLGFASVAGYDWSLQHNKLYSTYYKKLISAEGRAEKKGEGIWANERDRSPWWKRLMFIIPTFSLRLSR